MKTFDSFVDRHIGLNTKDDLREMLATIGVASVEELLQQVIPQNIRLKKDLDLVRHSVENGCGKDAPGNLAHYMVDNTVMHAWPMSAGRFDIGSLDSYEEAKQLFG